MALTFGVVQVAYSPLIVEWDQKAIDPLYADRLARLQARLSTAGNAPLLIVLGSSKAAVGIVGAPLEAHFAAAGGRQPVAFNFACGGCGPVMETITLQRLLRDGIRPALVVIETFPALLADENGGVVEARWTVADRLTLAELTRIAPLGPFDRAAHPPWMRRLVPTYAYRTRLVRRLGASWLPANVDTPVGNDVTVNAWGELPYRLPAEISDAQRRLDTENRRVEYTWLCRR